MPTYDYECESCGHEFEAFHGMLVDALTDCPKCKQPKLIKLISAGAAVIVKGTENPCTGGRGHNTKKKDKMGEGKYKNKDHWWRTGKINKKILNNPKKYIQEGVE